MKNILFFCLVLLSFSCHKDKKVIFDKNLYAKKRIVKIEKKNWQLLDPIQDTIPGISLNRAYRELIKNKNGKEIIIAVIDTQLDINHEEIKDNIWLNSKEIPNNLIDDDQNGYSDDINGWNFLGIKKDSTVFSVNYESIRILRKYNYYTDNLIDNILFPENSKMHNLYYRAIEHYQKNVKQSESDQEYVQFLIDTYPKSVKALHEFFPNNDYTIKQLDSLYEIVNKKNEELGKLVYYMSDYIKYNLSENWIKNYKKGIDRVKDSILNLTIDGRSSVGDNLEDLKDCNYGNNNVSKYSEFLSHSTEVTGLIVANRKNKIGIDGIINNIKIMPICISCYGDEHDKDIALAIRYAVDNGANIINMSFYKEFSLEKKWVDDAMKYASKKNVLIIAGAGNNGKNIKIKYPNDIDEKGIEFVNNFISVGSSSYSVNKNLMSSFSNYHHSNVDVFAPGDKILTTMPKDKYKLDSGTSLSTSIVSGTAALVWSYYPNLKAHEVKEIIMQSGVAYDIEVEIYNENGKKKLVPFSSLSKSGKIVNAYNALLMAKHYKHKK